MALGVKFKTVKTTNAYTLEELFEAIKDRFRRGVSGGSRVPGADFHSMKTAPLH